MNSTIDRPWYTQHCVPFMAIEACPREGDQARRVWAAVYIAMDISSLLFISATLIRRWIYVAEPFNTLRLMLIKFLLSLPLFVILRYSRELDCSPFSLLPASCFPLCAFPISNHVLTSL